MFDRVHPFAQLADKARQNPEAGEHTFWQEMKPQLERMVRRVVRSGPSSSSLEQKIGRELDQASRGADNSISDNVIGVVARRLCREMYERLLTPTPVNRPWLNTRAAVVERTSATTLNNPQVALSA